MDMSNKARLVFSPVTGLEKKLALKKIKRNKQERTNLVFSSWEAELALWGAGFSQEALEVATWI